MRGQLFAIQLLSINSLEWISTLTPCFAIWSKYFIRIFLRKRTEVVPRHDKVYEQEQELKWLVGRGEPSTLANWRGAGRQLGTKLQLMKRPGSPGGRWEGHQWHLHIAIIEALCVATKVTQHYVTTHTSIRSRAQCRCAAKLVTPLEYSGGSGGHLESQLNMQRRMVVLQKAAPAIMSPRESEFRSGCTTHTNRANRTLCENR